MQLKEVTGLLREKEPVLHDPDGLTSGIMQAIRHKPTIGVKWFRNAERLLAAASLALLLVFGYEQFTTVAQIRSLEKQIAQTGRSPRMHITRLQGADLASLTPYLPACETQRLLSNLKNRSPFSPGILLRAKTISK